MQAVTIIYGTEEYIMAEGRRKFVAYWQEQCGGELPIETFAKDAAPAKVVEALEGSSLFGSGSLVIWQDCPFLPLRRGGRSRTKLGKDEQWLLEKIEALPPESALLFITKGNLDTGSAFFKRLRPLADVINGEAVTDKTIMAYVTDYVRQKGKSLTRQAVVYLQDVFQTWSTISLLYVFSEIDKLCITLDDEQTVIDVPDVRPLFAGTMEKNLYTFMDYFLRRKGEQAIPFLEGLFGKPDQFIKNTAYVVSRLRLLLAYKELQQARMGERQCVTIMTQINNGKNAKFLLYHLKKVASYWKIEELDTLLSRIFTLQLNIRRGVASSADMGPLLCVYCSTKGRV